MRSLPCAILLPVQWLTTAGTGRPFRIIPPAAKYYSPACSEVPRPCFLAQFSQSVAGTSLFRVNVSQAFNFCSGAQRQAACTQSTMCRRVQRKGTRDFRPAPLLRKAVFDLPVQVDRLEFAIPNDFIQSVQPYVQITFLLQLRLNNPGKQA